MTRSPQGREAAAQRGEAERSVGPREGGQASGGGPLHRLDRLSLACFALILLALSIFGEVNSDLGFHLRAGEYIWREGQIPTHDFFSYIAEGRRWVDSQWGFQLLLHAAYAAGGATGLVGLRIVLVGTLFALLLAVCHRRGPLPITLGVGLLVVFICYQRFFLRPELLSFVFLAAFVLGSERFREHPRTWLVVLPAIQVIWVNCHGIHVLGPVYLGMRFAGDALQALAHRFTSRIRAPESGTRELAQRGALALLCSLALLANANGIDGIRYPFWLFGELRGGVAWFPNLAELVPPFAYDVRSPLDSVAFYRSFVPLSLLALAVSWRRVRLADLLLYAAFLYLSLGAIRNMPLFAAVAMPITVGSLHGAWSDLGAQGRSTRSHRIAVVTCASIAIVAAATWIGVTTNRLYRELGMYRRFGVAEFDHVPAEIVERLRAIDGRFLNDFDSGGYLIWKLYPDKQVALDGRWEVYGDLVPRLLAAFQEPDVFEALTRQYDIQAVVLSRYSGVTAAMVELLGRRADFRLSLRTRKALLYERVRD